MAPAVLPQAPPPIEHIRQLSRSISNSLPSLPERQALPPASRFASVLHRAAGESISQTRKHLQARDGSSSDILSVAKRQQTGILAIPTTYTGLNAGPNPGAVVGIVLGSVGGFLLALFLVYSVVRLSGRFGTRVVEEEIITRRRSQSRSSRSESEVIEVAAPRRERRRRRTEEIIVEERISRAASPEDDIVEVIEEHSPERPMRKESKRSGFRTVDPAELGGGGRPMRKVSKR